MCLSRACLLRPDLEQLFVQRPDGGVALLQGQPDLGSGLLSLLISISISI